VIEAVDGPITLNRCARSPHECPRDATCAVHPIWLSLRDELRLKLASITFHAIAQRARSAAAGHAPIRMQDIPIFAA